MIPSKHFWAFAQFSKFARPGARRVEAVSSEPLFYASSFVNRAGCIATQLINNATQAYDVNLRWRVAALPVPFSPS